MIEWLKRMLGPQTSSSTAKERLRLVLMTDHLALAPEIIENMKRDLVDVISRYVEVDREKVEIDFEREDRALAMMASIPIIAVNRPTGGGGSHDEKPAKPEAAPPAASATPSTASPSVNAATEPPKRRRRKKQPSSKPATAH
ncbi:MAG: cell division topological specificity factor MinE [bacterium]|nr:cell division topological specificity factor MinE [bacterium]